MTAESGRHGKPPSVERVLAAARPRAGDRDPDAILTVARAVVDDERNRIQGGTPARTVDALGAQVVAALEAFDGPPRTNPREPDAIRVINATGVMVHTNLGRAGWPAAAIEAARRQRRARRSWRWTAPPAAADRAIGPARSI